MIEEDNFLYVLILIVFDWFMGCLVLINMFFNVWGELIVCMFEDVYRCFMCIDMDYFVLENCIFLKWD